MSTINSSLTLLFSFFVQNIHYIYVCIYIYMFGAPLQKLMFYTQYTSILVYFYSKISSVFRPTYRTADKGVLYSKDAAF